MGLTGGFVSGVLLVGRTELPAEGVGIIVVLLSEVPFLPEATLSSVGVVLPPQKINHSPPTSSTNTAAVMIIAMRVDDCAGARRALGGVGVGADLAAGFATGMGATVDGPLVAPASFGVS